jgi:Fur family transcriptional regulator, ferric uptake regulator
MHRHPEPLRQGISITVARTRDIADMARLHADIFPPGWTTESFSNLLSPPTGDGFVARLRGKLIGFGILRTVLDEAEIITIAVAPQHQRQGLGRQLLGALENTAGFHGAKTCFLDVAEDNAAALKLYASFGYLEIGRRREYYPGEDGRIDALMLSRDLPLNEESLDSGRDGAHMSLKGIMEGPMDRIERLCVEKGLRMTEQRRVIARVLSSSKDHPDVEELHRRAVDVDKDISIATVYRTVRLLTDHGILESHDFGDGRARFEEAHEEHHDHLIDTKTGRVIEFVDPEIERLQVEIARRLGYRLIDHRLELYGVPLTEEKPG